MQGKFIAKGSGAHFKFMEVFDKLEKVQRQRLLLEDDVHGLLEVDKTQRLIKKFKLQQQNHKEEENSSEFKGPIRKIQNIIDTAKKQQRKVYKPIADSFNSQDSEISEDTYQSNEQIKKSTYRNPFKKQKVNQLDKMRKLSQGSGAVEKSNRNKEKKSEIDEWLDRECEYFFKVRKRIQNLTYKDKNTIQYTQNRAIVRANVFQKDTKININKKIK
eukprot:403361202